MESILIKDIKKKERRVDIYLEPSEGLRKYFISSLHFFAEFTFPVEDIPDSILVVPLLTNLLPFSWIVNAVVWVNEIDSDFYDCIQPLKASFRELHPAYKLEGTLIAAKCIHNSFEKQKNVIQLFTGGIDASASLIRNINKNPILFNTNGWFHDDPTEECIRFNSDYQAICSIASSYHLSTCFVKSNFASFIIPGAINHVIRTEKHEPGNWWFSYQHSLAFLGCAVVAGYYYRSEQIYIASSYTFGQYIVCVSDPRIDSCIKCAGLSVIHDGYELSRQDKVRLIADYQKKSGLRTRLIVCSYDTNNCCNCEKCFRSMLALVAEGADDLSQFGFDLDDTLLNKLKVLLTTKGMDFDSDHIVFWEDIVGRMKENNAKVKYPEVLEYLSTIDLIKIRKEAIKKYYKKNLFSILKRKLHL